MNAIAFFDKKMFPINGFVKFHQCDPSQDTRITIDLDGFTDTNPHGIHIHTFGDLSQGCTSACDHYNPYDKLHGNMELHGNDRHVGDMINNVIPNKKGKVKIFYEDPLIDLFGENNVVGRMIVLHKNMDNLGIDRDIDKESAKTGKAGERIACAVIGLSKYDHF